MTVEIKELVIRASVGGASLKQPDAAAGGADTGKIVNQCVSQVLKILDRKKER